MTTETRERLERLAPVIVTVICSIIWLPLNFSPRLSFASSQNVSRLSFLFGFPLPYLYGDVPGSGQINGRGPNFIWGHRAMNSADEMRKIRAQRLTHLRLNPWSMLRFGNPSFLGGVVNLVLLIAVYPLTSYALRSVRSSRENAARFEPFSVGDRVQLASGEFDGHEATVDEIDEVKGHIVVRLKITKQTIFVNVTPEQLSKPRPLS